MSNLRKIRIDFRYFWPGFNPEVNFILQLLRPHYDISISKENPDFVFFSVFDENKTENRAIFPGLHSFLRKSMFGDIIKKIGFSQNRFRMPVLEGNFVKIFYTTENIVPDMRLCDWAFSFCYDEEFKHPRHMRLPFYLAAGNLEGLIKSIDPLQVLKSKVKFCNFVYSNDVGFRNKFFEKLNHYKKVDAPGRCMNTMPPIGHYENPLSSRYAPDWIETKVSFLKDYKFTIAFENESSPGWVTEKIVHPMLVNSIPIYFGHKLITRDFNENSFLFTSDCDNLDELVEKVIELDRNDDLYISIMQEPWLRGTDQQIYGLCLPLREI